MVKDYTADNLIESVRNRIFVGTKTAQGTDTAAILRHLNEVQLEKLTPWITGVNEEFLVHSREVQLVSGVSRYEIPDRAVYNSLRDIVYVDTNSNRTKIELILPSELSDFNQTQATNAPLKFYVQHNTIVLVPDRTASFSGTLEMSFETRPGDLVLVAETRVIQSVDTDTKTITLTSNVPSTWTNGTIFDIHSPDSGADLRDFDLTGTTVSGNSITFTEAIDGSVFGSLAVQAGDYVVLARETALPTLPKELHPLLITAACAQILKGKGDMERYQLFMADLQQSMTLSLRGLESRVKGKPHIFSGQSGPLWASKRSFGSRWRT